MKGDQATFGDVTITVLLKGLWESSQSKWLDLVFDVYQENSIKNCERSVQGEETGHQLHSIVSTQIVRQMDGQPAPRAILDLIYHSL